jgi:predicted O-methyltransferase YrrM
MDWTAGYASDIEYTAGYYREQSPTHLNFTCVLNGYEPVDVTKPFTYCELGFGRGLTANLLAATHSNGTFYAVDFNPAHVAGAQALANAAGLANLVLLEKSFAELAESTSASLPQFDFITLHGIFTWVTVENQQHIVDFIARHLKPGGIVYVSYNALPGWSAVMPLQRLFIEHAQLHPGRSEVQVREAAAFASRMKDAGAAYFTSNTVLNARMEALQTASGNYLVHEYMHNHWKPLYFSDVARQLADAKLNFVGVTEFSLAYPRVFMSPEKQALLDSVPEGDMRESIKDYIFNTGFRKDVYVRGARKMSPPKHAAILGQYGLSLIVKRADAKVEMKLSLGTVSGQAELYEPVFDALVQGPKTLKELHALPQLAGQSLANLVQIAALLTASGQAEIFFAGTMEQSPDSAQRMNRALAEMAAFNDDFQALCSPLTGNGVEAGFLERLVYLAIARNGDAAASSVVRTVWGVMKGQGRFMIRDGVTLSTDEENLNELFAKLDPILTHAVPKWRQLRMI